jgi:hypothetical protein
MRSKPSQTELAGRPYPTTPAAFARTDTAGLHVIEFKAELIRLLALIAPQSREGEFESVRQLKKLAN